MSDKTTLKFNIGDRIFYAGEWEVRSFVVRAIQVDEEGIYYCAGRRSQSYGESEDVFSTFKEAVARAEQLGEKSDER